MTIWRVYLPCSKTVLSSKKTFFLAQFSSKHYLQVMYDSMTCKLQAMNVATCHVPHVAIGHAVKMR